MKEMERMQEPVSKHAGDDPVLRNIGKQFPEMPLFLACRVVDLINIYLTEKGLPAYNVITIENIVRGVARANPQWCSDAEFQASVREQRADVILDKWGWVPFTYEELIIALDCVGRHKGCGGLIFENETEFYCKKCGEKKSIT